MNRFEKTTRLLKAALLLNLLLAGWTLLLRLIFGAEAFSPYVREMAGSIMSVRDISIYLLSLSLYGFFLELLLRRVVQQKLQRYGKAALLAPVIIYMAIHLRYGWFGCLYAGGAGLLLTLWFERRNCWKELSLWHAQWGAVTVALCMLLCVIADGRIREDFLFAYKKRHLRKGLLYYRCDWGWVDKVHYRPDHFEEIHRALKEGRKELTLGDSWVTPLRIPVSFSATYRLTPGTDAEQRWAQCCGIMLDFMELNETVQEQSPWYHGNQLSAWQFDDVSSALLCSLDHRPETLKSSAGKEIRELSELLQKWQQLGRREVGRKVDAAAAWQQAGPRYNSLKRLVQDCSDLWQRSSVNTP